MTSLDSYRRLLGLVGPTYVAVAFVARIPLAMAQIGTLLLVAQETGSYGAGGATAGALAVANALGSPVAGSLADRLGQRPVVLLQSSVGAVGLVGVVVGATQGAPLPVLLVVAALAGLALPQVGPLARVRWRPVTRGEQHQHRLVATAFSYEGAADEASFVLGPALVGLVAALISPAGALLVAAVTLGVFGTLFGLHRTAPPGAGRVDHGATGPLVTGAVLVLLAAQFFLGTLFGSIQTGTTVLATAEDVAGAAGLLHALLGVGSASAAIVYASLPDRFRLADRLVVAAVALLVLSAPLLLVDGLVGVALVTLALGFAVAPYMVTTFTLAERVVPLARVGTAMTLLAGATGLGYAAGSALAGRLADAARAGDLPGGLADLGGHTAAYVVTVTATACATVLAVLARRALVRAAVASEADTTRWDGASAPDPSAAPVA
ncbi:MFS transporter [Nocardioides sp. ChNu-153]|uniref:MFS transporter n=1 Tax=unclassified Nocardioides TaxID=2615069 RepID=UPI002404D3EA|nr:MULTISPECIES: MFS transporter [unclassified Nocardioides]MDF9715062.1 MFS transporter [Nocardioides sp. ChNu-99]MDN7122331.1 MFS transporter [Nocardioides sp. ChNu-153]